MITVLFSTLISFTLQNNFTPWRDTDDSSIQFEAITSWKHPEDPSFREPSEDRGWVRGEEVNLGTGPTGTMTTFVTRDEEFLELHVRRERFGGITLENLGQISLIYHVQELSTRRWLQENIEPQGRHRIYSEESTLSLWAVKAETHNENNQAGPSHS